VGICVTVSVGVAQLAPEQTERDFFESADSAVYKAKKNGRNRVVLGGQPGARARARKSRRQGS
jgi:diguanylate cyclase (GGDEF)-like protein